MDGNRRGPVGTPSPSLRCFLRCTWLRIDPAMVPWATLLLLGLLFCCCLGHSSQTGAPRVYLTYKDLTTEHNWAWLASSGFVPKVTTGGKFIPSLSDLCLWNVAGGLLGDLDSLLYQPLSTPPHPRWLRLCHFKGPKYPLSSAQVKPAHPTHHMDQHDPVAALSVCKGRGERIHWPALPNQENECRLAGKGQRGECFNYIRLMEPLNRTHLYACGTGAYHPVCILINRGWRSEEYLFRTVPHSLEPGKGKCPYDPRQSSMAVLVNSTLYAGVHVDFMGTDAALFRTMGPRPAVRTEQHDSRWLYDPVFLQAHVIPDSSDHSDDKLYFFFREKALEGAVGPAVLARVGRVCLDEKHPLLYGVFSTLGSVFRGSAVCVYSMADIRTVFNGPFAHKEGHNYQWGPYTGRVPYPRPGACPGGTFTPGLRSTREFSDELVTFVRAHPLMFHAVYPLQRRPLLVRTNVPYSFTTLAVDLVDAVDGRYEVLFLGTDQGTVQKVIVLPKEQGILEELTLEEVEVFRVPAPVKTLWISSKRQQLYVSSDMGVSQLSLHRCREYGEACADCCLARDPYCAWDGQRCARYSHTAKSMEVLGNELPRDRILLQTPQGVLLGPVMPSDSGLYQCIGTENRFRHTLRRLRLHVLPRALLEGAISSEETPTLGICESYWQQFNRAQAIQHSQGGHQSHAGPSLWGSEQQSNWYRATQQPSLNWTTSSPHHSQSSSSSSRRRHHHHHRSKPWAGHRTPPRS
ncbi:hypothetical protein Chor_007131 [Crotalus horridus]